MGPTRVREVRCRGGNLKFRALRLETGNYSWGSEVATRKTRILDVVHNATNNEMVRTKTLVKGAIVSIDATPFRQWYEAHYGVTIGHKKGKKVAAKTEDAPKKSESAQRRLAARQKTRTLDPALDDQFASGRILACISSRPGQVGRADGYILEGKELEFYQKLVSKKKGSKH
jgi:small subunit ribosomal protein S8e